MLTQGRLTCLSILTLGISTEDSLNSQSVWLVLVQVIWQMAKEFLQKFRSGSPCEEDPSRFLARTSKRRQLILEDDVKSARSLLAAPDDQISPFSAPPYRTSQPAGSRWHRPVSPVPPFVRSGPGARSLAFPGRKPASPSCGIVSAFLFIRTYRRSNFRAAGFLCALERVLHCACNAYASVCVSSLIGSAPTKKRSLACAPLHLRRAVRCGAVVCFVLSTRGPWRFHSGFPPADRSDGSASAEGSPPAAKRSVLCALPPVVLCAVTPREGAPCSSLQLRAITFQPRLCLSSCLPWLLWTFLKLRPKWFVKISTNRGNCVRGWVRIYPDNRV